MIGVPAFLGLVRSLIPLPGTTALFLTPRSVQSYVNVIDGEYLANNIWPCFHAGNIYGLLCSFIFYIKGIFPLPLVAASPSWHNAHLVYHYYDFFSSYIREAFAGRPARRGT